MSRPKCERCHGALLGEYTEPGILVVKCPVCGWRRTRETPEHPVLTVAEAKSGVRIDVKKQEAEMAKKQECRRCGRMIQVVKDGSCDRCLRRIANGLDPVTGEAVAPLVPEPLMTALVDLAEEAVERVTELGEIDGAEVTTDAEWEAAGWVKKSTDDGSDPLLPDWGEVYCAHCGKLKILGECCSCFVRGVADDSEGGEEWSEADKDEVEPDSPVKPLCRYTWQPVDCAAGSIVPASPEDVADMHLEFIEDLLVIHGEEPKIIDLCLFHYKKAFIQGWKHGQKALQ